jgi:tetratricopeptide (TPR) repeat protein
MPNQPALSTQPPPGRKPSWLLRLSVMIVAPIAAIALLEGLLRLVGFGYPAAFLLAESRNGQHFYVQNNQFGWRFMGPQLSRTPNALSIPQPKPADTVRIFVFGESAANGDPLPAFGLSRMLLALLSLRYPGTHFEIENAAITGINSHAILPIARDCAPAQGDLWVLYMGNNEVVGPFGAGTIFGPQVPPLPLIRASLCVKATRTGQLLDSLRQALLPAARKQSAWTGMAMFLNQQVRAQDPRMDRVYRHFNQNLADILDAAKHCGAGVVLSTVAVNLKDCSPLASAHRPGLSEPDQTRWETLYDQGLQALACGSNALAADRFQEAARIDDAFAALRFAQGQCALALGQVQEAQAQFVAARDLDTLRFRCDSRLNESIRKAAQAPGQRIRLADAERAFGQQSPEGVPGEEWFYEHVHLTFEGNYLLACTIADQLEQLLPVPVAQSPARRAAWPTRQECAQRLAWSDWSHAEALRQMLGRVSQPPFSAQPDHEVRIQHLQAALEKLAPATEPAGINKAVQECEQALVAAPDDPWLYAQLTMLKMGVGDYFGAEGPAARQTELLPSNQSAWSQLGMILLREGRGQEALEAFDRAIALDPYYLSALVDRANVLARIGRPEDAMREFRRFLRIHPSYTVAWITLGQLYEHSGRRAEAEDCYRKAVAGDADTALSGTLARFCQSRGWLEAAATNYAAALKLEPTNARLRIAAGQNLVDLQRYAPAVEQFREAVRLKPEWPESRLGLGIALARDSRYAEALAEFEEVLRRDPTNALALKYAYDSREKIRSGQGR